MVGLETSGKARSAVKSRRLARAWRQATAIAGVVAAAAGVYSVAKPDPPPRFVGLLWGPSDCKSEEPLVGLGTCGETRTLSWLRAQILRLKSMAVPGYAQLPGEIELKPIAHRGERNWILNLAAGGLEGWSLGVGYDAATGAKDGLLRIYRAGATQPWAPATRIDVDGQWWFEKSEGKWLKAGKP